jgi:membrane protein implicated in regulation of membrane protease activity
MHSSLIGKIEKARRYAQQPERVRIQAMDLIFHGEHDTYHVTLEGETWRCSCHFFDGFGTCAHVMGVQRMFEVMLSPEARTTAGVAQAV